MRKAREIAIYQNGEVVRELMKLAQMESAAVAALSEICARRQKLLEQIQFREIVSGGRPACEEG